MSNNSNDYYIINTKNIQQLAITAMECVQKINPNGNSEVTYEYHFMP